MERVAKEIHKDDSILVEPVIDRDTQGVAGSPDIANTIFNKIRECQVFVCDVSIINNGKDGRLTPNPNVLVELGFAVGVLGWERIVLVMNTAFGEIESLPFDLRMRRITSYTLPVNFESKADMRRVLEGKLGAALREILRVEMTVVESTPAPPSIVEQAITAIEDSQPNAPVLARKYLSWLVEELIRLFPEYKEDRLDLLLTQADDPTQVLASEFSTFAKAIAATNNIEIAKAVYEGFVPILELYEYPSDYFGEIQKTEFDFYRFLGHELFVSFFSAFLANKRWALIAELLSTELYISNVYRIKSTSVLFTYASRHVATFNTINDREKLNRISLHADVLNKRHTESSLAKIVPAQSFMEADFFLYLTIPHAQLAFGNWHPWSVIYLNRPPSYLSQAASCRFAEQLLSPMNVENVQALREHVSDCIARLQEYYRSCYHEILERFDPQIIGSRS
ncbi:hypothetical protein V2H45_08340 [Tumidithrix elongata RA019]|uniref:CD-NTase-associated protein 12/Pycsar effector protein TIR domain-containing protein n=1 Tax=Tumidithrix elongata BACA0141 TaxID=2716417 RepID=A0AAW9PRM8_9CYAN|nr:hypothetical protein [Tumidithrix elongata RA019]